jgi:folate-binding protein YgfZ
VADMFVYKISDNEFLVDIASVFCDDVIKKFNFYKLQNDVNFNVTDLMVVSVAEKSEGLCFMDVRGGNLGYRLLMVNCLTAENEELYCDMLIEQKCVDGVWLEVNKSFILEYGFEQQNAVDFNKGCYPGQELITRTKRTGVVRKHIYKALAVVSDEKVFSRGENIIINGDKIGVIVAINSLQNAALLLLRTEDIINTDQHLHSENGYFILT